MNLQDKAEKKTALVAALCLFGYLYSARSVCGGCIKESDNKACTVKA